MKITEWSIGLVAYGDDDDGVDDVLVVVGSSLFEEEFVAISVTGTTKQSSASSSCFFFIVIDSRSSWDDDMAYWYCWCGCVLVKTLLSLQRVGVWAQKCESVCFLILLLVCSDLNFGFKNIFLFVCLWLLRYSTQITNVAAGAKIFGWFLTLPYKTSIKNYADTY